MSADTFFWFVVAVGIVSFISGALAVAGLGIPPQTIKMQRYARPPRRALMRYRKVSRKRGRK